MRYWLACIVIFFCAHTSAQVAINNNNHSAHSSAMLDVSSNNKGLLMPRMTTANRTAISNPAKGLTVYDSTTNSIWYYDTQWRELITNQSSDNQIVQQQSPLSSVNMISNSSSQVNDSAGYVYDPGGPNNNYSLNEYSNLVINAPGNMQYCRLTIVNANLGAGDSLKIIGPDLNISLKGNVTNQTYMLGWGSIYLYFYSDANITASGFQIKYEFFFLNNTSSSSLSSTATGFHYIPEKIAVRGGLQTLNNWYKDSVGAYSFAYGAGAKSKGDQALAIGGNASASSFGSIAIGYYANAIYNNAIAIGSNASCFNGIAIGEGSKSLGSYTTAIGYRVEANHIISTAFGGENISSGYASTVMGYGNKAKGYYSTATGNGIVAKGYASTVVGLYNDSLLTNDQDNLNTSTPLFVVGNGFNDALRSNAFAIQRLGQVYIDPTNQNQGSVTSNALLFGTYNGTGEGISSRRIGTGNLHGLDLFTSYTKRLSITNSGNVGIGTDEPAQKLEVNGRIRQQTYSQAVTINANSGYIFTWTHNLGYQPIIMISLEQTGGAFMDYVSFSYSHVNNNQLNILLTNRAGNTANGIVRWIVVW